jgi:hypothetical protein
MVIFYGGSMPKNATFIIVHLFHKKCRTKVAEILQQYYFYADYKLNNFHSNCRRSGSKLHFLVIIQHGMTHDET